MMVLALKLFAVSQDSHESSYQVAGYWKRELAKGYPAVFIQNRLALSPHTSCIYNVIFKAKATGNPLKR
jgi:hypothetical protein